MRAIRQYEFGGPEKLRYEQVADPVAADGQVRVAVAAAGVHLVDTVVRSGTPWGPLGLPELPMTPGREVAGVVDEVGAGVDSGWLGTRVATHLGPANGGYAEFAVREVESVRALPRGLSFDAAVAMIGTGRTSVGILEAAALSSDDVVLVTAAAGGIGSLLVQAGGNLGATVVGLAGGAAKVARVRELGATVVVDYRQPGWADAVREALEGREVTVALDGVGGELGRATMELLAAGGRLVMFGWASAHGTPTEVTTDDLVARGLTVTWAIGPGMARRRGQRELEEQALAEATSGRLVPAVQTFPLSDSAGAHRALETRATLGKVVLVP